VDPDQPKKSDNTGSQHAEDSRQPHMRWNWVKDVTIPVIVAVVALSGTYLGSCQATRSGQEIQLNQIAEERAKVDRERRSAVYLRFMNVSTEYVRRRNREISDCESSRRDKGSSVDESPSCVEVGNDKAWDLLREFSMASHEVYIFGSDAANKAAEDVAFHIPKRPGVVVGGISNPSGPQPEKLDDFIRSYDAFLKIACQEMPARPRSNC
jgi:hypothetical protein